MEVRFDSFNRFETPNFTLCSPGSEYEDGKLTNVIGSLYLTSDEEIVANFNEMSELNLVAYQDPEDAPVAIYDHVKNRSNIFVDGIGFFNITSVDETIENGMKYKNVRANSCEAEIENRIMPVEFYSQESEVDYSYNVTFQFTTLLEMLVANLPLWQIGYVDPELEDLYRTFEDVSEETNILSFMITDMQDAYECIFSFDTIHRLINVYSQNNYVRETSIHLSNSDIVNSINITENSDDIYTAISVFGEDELTITAVNPTGSNTIYKFDYYLDVMPAALRTKVVAWQNRVDEVSSVYFTYSAGYYNYLSEKNILVYDLDAINTQIEMYQKLRDNIVASSNYANATLLAYVTKSALTHSVMNIVDEFNKSGVTYKIAPYYADSVEVASNKASIAYVPTGSVGSEIKAVYVKGSDGIYTKKLTQSSSVSDTTFTYSRKVLTFKSGLLPNGTQIDVFYHTSDSSVVEDAVIITDVISDIDRELTSLRNQAIAKQSDIDDIDVNLERLKQSRERISDEVYINNYFTQEELELLSLYTYEGSYTDDYITITDRMTPQERLVQMKSLYDRAKLQLEKIAEPTAEFNVDTENFIFQSKFADWAEELETGCLINVELHPNDVAKLFLSSFIVNYQDASLSMRFGNRFNKYDAKSLFEKVLGNVNRTANSLQYVKETLYPIRSGEYNLIKEALENIRTLSAGQALAASNQDFMIDSTGVTGKQSDGSGGYLPEQLKIVNNMIAMTDDAWETCKIAIGKILLGDNTYRYGINAEVLMGNIIMGNELHIMTTDEEGNPYDLITAIDDKIALSVREIEGEIDDLQIGVRNLLYDTNASTMSPVDGEGVRYFHNETTFEENAIGTEWQEISDPPVYGINYGAKHVCTVANGDPHELVFYAATTNEARNVMVPGETYTFSMWCKSSVANTIVQFTSSDVASNIQFKDSYTERITLDTANTWTKCVWTFDYIGSTNNPYLYAGYIYNLVGTVYCCGYKLEVGDKSTDWSDYYIPPDDRGGTNLIQNLKPIDLSSRDSYPNINGYIPAGIRYAVTNTEITNAVNGVTQTVTGTTTAMLLGINFGSQYDTETEAGAKTLYGLAIGTPYTFSYDCTAKLFSGTITSTTTYFLSTFLYIFNTNTSAWELYKTQYHIPSFVYDRGVVKSARCKFTFVLPDYASSFLLRVGISDITSDQREYFAYGDYITIENLMLEEGTLASRWQEASADIEKRTRIERQADLQVLSDRITGSVEQTISETANGLRGSIDGVIDRLDKDYSTTEQTATNISQAVGNLRTELSGDITKLESNLNQTASEISATFKKNDEVLSYFSAQADGFYIGSGTSTIKLRETATSIQFIETTTNQVLAEFNTAGLISSRIDTEDQIAISEGGSDQWAIRKGTAVDGKNNLNIVWLGG